MISNNEQRENKGLRGQRQQRFLRKHYLGQVVTVLLNIMKTLQRVSRHCSRLDSRIQPQSAPVVKPKKICMAKIDVREAVLLCKSQLARIHIQSRTLWVVTLYKPFVDKSTSQDLVPTVETSPFCRYDVDVGVAAADVDGVMATPAHSP